MMDLALIWHIVYCLLGCIGMVFSMALIFNIRGRMDAVRQQSLLKLVKKEFENYLISTAENEGPRQQSVRRYQHNRFRQLLNSSFKKDIFLAHLIRMTRELKGEFTDTLLNLYEDLGLSDYSIAKINSPLISRKIRGVQEVGDLHYKKVHGLVLKYAGVKNQALREEVTVAAANLSVLNPLAFLERLTYDLSDWVQLRLHSILNNSDFKHTLAFNEWMGHHLPSVRAFMVKMVVLFKRIDQLEHVIPLAKDPNEVVRKSVFEAIEQLGDDSHFEILLSGLLTEPKLEMKIAALRAIAATGTEIKTEVLLKLLQEFSDSGPVKFEVVRTLYSIHNDPKNVIFNHFSGSVPADIELMSRHIVSDLP